LNFVEASDHRLVRGVFAWWLLTVTARVRRATLRIPLYDSVKFII